jgi:hypothetical protein
MRRYNTQDDRLDAALFDEVRNGTKEYDDDLVFKKLYDSGDKNNYYRLKNRVADDILDQLALMHTSKNKTFKVYQTLILFNVFLSKSKYEISYYLLNKCEKLALEIEHIELLDHIYSEYIRLSLNYYEINPEIYIKKRNSNLTRLNDLRELDQVIAAVHYRLITTLNYSKNEKTLHRLLEKTIEEYSQKKNLLGSKLFQKRMFKVVSQQLIQKKDYINLYKYCLTTKKTFIQKKWFDKTEHETQIQFQIYLANSLYLQKKYDESLYESEQLKELLPMYNNLNYNKYIAFYYNAIFACYFEIDFDKSIASLDAMELEMKKQKSMYYLQIISTNRALVLYRSQKYDAALKSIFKLTLNDEYKKRDESFRFKFILTELMILVESDDIEGLIIRYEQVRTEFKKWAIKNSTCTDLMVFQLIGYYAKHDRKKHINKIISLGEQLLIELVKRQETTNLILNFEKWFEINKP